MALEDDAQAAGSARGRPIESEPSTVEGVTFETDGPDAVDRESVALEYRPAANIQRYRTSMSPAMPAAWWGSQTYSAISAEASNSSV